MSSNQLETLVENADQAAIPAGRDRAAQVFERAEKGAFDLNMDNALGRMENGRAFGRQR